MSSEFNEKNYSLKMDKTIQSFKKEISTLRTGRANSSMLDMIKVDVYGQMMPINQLATISVPEARLITVQVWDKSNVNLIDSAIQKSDLGINPQIDGQIVRIRIPDLTEERRKELIKVLNSITEKITICFTLIMAIVIGLLFYKLPRQKGYVSLMIGISLISSLVIFTIMFLDFSVLI